MFLDMLQDAKLKIPPGLLSFLTSMTSASTSSETQRLSMEAPSLTATITPWLAAKSVHTKRVLDGVSRRLSHVPTQNKFSATEIRVVLLPSRRKIPVGVDHHVFSVRNMSLSLPSPHGEPLSHRIT